MLFWPIGLVLMHFCLFRIDSFEFTIGTAACLAVVVYLSATVKIASLRTMHLSIVFLCCFLIYTLLLCISAIDFTEFMESFLQVCILVLILTLCLHIQLPHPKILERSAKLFLALCVSVSLLVIFQFVLLNFFDSYALMNLYGPFSPMGPGYAVYEPHPLSLIRRPNGVFSEPSVAGWFLVLAVSVAIASPNLRKKESYYSAIICGTGAIATLSLSAIINILILSLVSLWVKSKDAKKFYSHAGLILLLFIFLGWVIIEANILNRLGNFHVEGTSIYYRLNAPLTLLLESIREFPFGHPLGQDKYILSKHYMINWKFGSFTNIDNSFLLISYYFGILGVAASMIVISVAAYLVLNRSNSALILVALLLALAETGALWSPNIVLLIGYSIILIRFIRTIEV